MLGRAQIERLVRRHARREADEQRGARDEVATHRDRRDAPALGVEAAYDRRSDLGEEERETHGRQIEVATVARPELHRDARDGGERSDEEEKSKRRAPPSSTQPEREDEEHGEPNERRP